MRYQPQKVAWMESQFLYPQHFQQQDRYVEHIYRTLIQHYHNFYWGVLSYKIDETLLLQSQFGLIEAEGLMPDTTVFQLPKNSPLPSAIHIPSLTTDTLIYLALSHERPGVSSIKVDPNDIGSYRYHVNTIEVYDNSQHQSQPEEICCAELSFSLVLESQPMEGMCRLPIARIQEVTPEGRVILDPKFNPTALNVNTNGPLSYILREIVGMISQRSKTLSLRFSQSYHEKNSSGSIFDFMLLQLCNRYEPLLKHYSQLPQLHPETLFRCLLQLSGELSSFTDHAKRLDHDFHYAHQDQASSFSSIHRYIQQQLNAVLEHKATHFRVEPKGYGVYSTVFPDSSVLDNARLIIGIKCKDNPHTFKESLTTGLKIGSPDTIRSLVNNQLTGIQSHLLPGAPPEINFQSGTVFFELEAMGPYWDELKKTAAIALHISGDHKDLEIQLWSIRQ